MVQGYLEESRYNVNDSIITAMLGYSILKNFSKNKSRIPTDRCDDNFKQERDRDENVDEFKGTKPDDFFYIL